MNHNNDPDVEAFLDAVRIEIYRARALFPTNAIMMCALAEELGEISRAAMEEPASQVRAEAVQLAAMATRLALEGDAGIDLWRVRQGLEPIASPSGISR